MATVAAPPTAAAGGSAPGSGAAIPAGNAAGTSAAPGKASTPSLQRKGVVPPVAGGQQQQQQQQTLRCGSARKEQPGPCELAVDGEDDNAGREYVLEQVTAEDEDDEEEDDEEFDYQHIPIEEFEDLDDELAEEDLEQAVRNINEKNFLGAFPEATVKPTEAMATLTKQPEVIDDYIRNYLSSKGMTRALDAFQNEWYELQQRGLLSPEDAIIVPDVYQRNMCLEEAIKKLRVDLEDYKDVANKARSTYSKLRKERDFHRMHHKRVLQEKNRLIVDIKKLKKHYANYEPMLKQIQHKYEIAMKERMLVRLERDKLAAKVQALEANLKESVGKEEARNTSTLASKGSGSVSRRGVPREAQLPAEDRPNQFATAARPPRSDILGSLGNLKRVHSFRAHDEAISSIKFHPRKMILVTGSDDKTWKMWAFPSGELIMSGEGHRDWLGDCDFHPRGTHLATASGDGTVKVWDFSKGQCTLTLSDHTQAVFSCAFHDQGEFLVSGSMDHTCKIWDLNTGKSRQTFHGHTDSVNHVSWMPYTNVVVTAACDKTVCLWDGRTGTCTQTLYGHGNAVNCAVFALQADKLATCDASGFLKVWDVRNLYAELDMVDLGPHPANRLCFDPSGTITAVASNEGAVKFWNAHERIRPGRDVVNPSLAGSAPNPVEAVAFDKTAEHLVAGGADGGINIFS